MLRFAIRVQLCSGKKSLIFAASYKPGYRLDSSGRKVRTVKSIAPVNSRVPIYRKQRVPQKITTPICRGKDENVG